MKVKDVQYITGLVENLISYSQLQTRHILCVSVASPVLLSIFLFLYGDKPDFKKDLSVMMLKQPD